VPQGLEANWCVTSPCWSFTLGKLQIPFPAPSNPRFARGFSLGRLRLPHVSPRWCGSVEKPHRVAPDIGRKVGVAHGHLHGRVAEEFLYLVENAVEARR